MTDRDNAPRPRLLVLTSTYPRWAGDPEPGFVHELSRRLGASFDVEVVGPGAPGALDEEVLDGVRIRRYRYAPRRLQTLVNNGGITTNLQRSRWKYLLLPGFLLGMLLGARAAVRRHRPEIIHAHWLMPQGVMALLLRTAVGRKIPTIVTSHGADLYGWQGRAFAWLKRAVVRHASRLVVVSRAMREELIRLGAEPGKIDVGPMGVDLLARFTPDPAVKRSTGEILFVGRLVEKKGLRHLLDAMPAIHAARPGATLTIAGFGPEQQARIEQVRAAGLEDIVHFHGPVSQHDLPALYRRAAVFVAPFVEGGNGDREGLGLVSLEAAGCGCPVVVSDLPAVRDAFSPGEALFSEPGNAVDIAAKVICVLRGKFQAPADLRETLVQRFDWECVAARYRAILMQATRDRGEARTAP